MQAMKAVRIHSCGVPEVLVPQDVPRPVPAAGTGLPLARAREAHELVQSGRSRGKVVLQVRPE